MHVQPLERTRRQLDQLAALIVYMFSHTHGILTHVCAARFSQKRTSSFLYFSFRNVFGLRASCGAIRSDFRRWTNPWLQRSVMMAPLLVISRMDWVQLSSVLAISKLFLFFLRALGRRPPGCHPTKQGENREEVPGFRSWNLHRLLFV